MARALILASGSPQRRRILESLGVAFEVRLPGVEELEVGEPEQVALENARRKAVAVAETAPPGAAVLGADTVVALGERMYGKPPDRAQARETLGALRGRRHTVIGGLCLIEHGRARAAAERTPVTFRSFDERMLEWYLDSGEWRDRAGGYAIQGRGGALIEAIEGDFLNVVGLSVVALLDLAPWLLGEDIVS